MKKIALGQGKGGVGKSTIAINLACVAVSQRNTAVVIDLDVEQGTALKWSNRRMKPAPAVGEATALTLLPKLREEKTAQWVFLDLPGRVSTVSGAGLRTADLVLVPCRPNDVDIEASFSTISAISGAGVRYAYLMSAVPPSHEKRAATFAKMLRDAGHPVAPVTIMQRTEIPDAIARGLGVVEYDPKGKAASEFRELFKWLKGELKA